jgi:hypothetical protein
MVRKAFRIITQIMLAIVADAVKTMNTGFIKELLGYIYYGCVFYT